MKRMCLIICLMGLVGVNLPAQDVVYSSLKDLLAHAGDTVAVLKVEKRTKNQITLTGGADYKISAPDNKALCSFLKKRCYVAQVDTAYYVNCKRLRYNRLRFGGWYAPAMWLNGNLYFYAMPVGAVAAGSSVTMDITLGGTIGDAIAAAGLVSKRVYYEINAKTGEVSFVGKQRMAVLLSSHPEWLKAYMKENSESAKTTGKYLRLLCQTSK